MSKHEPILGLARQAKRMHMEMQCDPQWVLDLSAERDTLRAEVDQLRAVQQQDALVAVQDGFYAAVADAERAAIEVFRDSCDHTRQAIEYMAAHMLAAAPTSATTA